MNKKILLIDDNPNILEAIELILTSENYDVTALVKVEDIVKDVKQIKPKLILLDLLLSGQNGKDLAKLLKKDQHTKDIPIIIVSAHPSAKRAALQAGVSAFLAKPFAVEELLDLVEKYTENSN